LQAEAPNLVNMGKSHNWQPKLRFRCCLVAASDLPDPGWQGPGDTDRGAAALAPGKGGLRPTGWR